MYPDVRKIPYVASTIVAKILGSILEAGFLHTFVSSFRVRDIARHDGQTVINLAQLSEWFFHNENQASKRFSRTANH
jgi:hypothetical protein